MARPRRPAALLATGTVVVLLAAWLSPPGYAPSPPSPTPASYRPLVTPVLSVRRDPSWVDDTLAGQRLTRSLDSITGPLLSSKGVQACVLVTRTGDRLYDRDATTELIPASNMKLVTATAALDTLGPSSRYTTTVEASAAARGGTIAGDLYLVGGGDPYLMTAEYDSRMHFPDPTFTSLDRLAAAVRAAGVAKVTGSVVGDGSRYDARVAVPTWPPRYLAEGDVGPLSALEVDDGSVPPGTPPAQAPPTTEDPGLYAAETFTALLKADGVRVAGPAATGRAPAGAVTVTQEESAPLSAAVDQMLTVSDDTAAELLTKELGYRESGQGTTKAGTEVIRRDVAADGLPATQLVALDGSGLDRGDRVTCTLIVDALRRAGTAGVIAAGLPVAGRTGTLTDRMVGTAAAGRLHAKTGTLNGVSSLSGFVDPPARPPTPELGTAVYFSTIINGMDSGHAAVLADRIGAAVAAYPQAVPLRLLEPGA